MYPALFDYKCKKRENSVPDVNPRNGPSFELNGNFFFTKKERDLLSHSSHKQQVQ